MWARAEPIRTRRLTLEPLSVAHASSMVDVLADPGLYAWTGGEPPTREVLEARYAVQSAGQSPDGTAGWLNWVVLRSATGRAAGFVQATITHEEETLVADVAWVVGAADQGDGVATEAAGALLTWLERLDVRTIHAFIHPGNLASAAVARRVGLVPTSRVVDGEVCWVRTAGG